MALCERITTKPNGYIVCIDLEPKIIWYLKMHFAKIHKYEKNKQSQLNGMRLFEYLMHKIESND